MPLVSTNTSTLFRRLDDGRYRYYGASPSVASSFSLRDDDDEDDDDSFYDESVVCASPSSASGQSKSKPASPPKEQRKPSMIQKYYGNADLSDRIGRTISVLVLTRFLVSVLAACVLHE